MSADAPEELKGWPESWYMKNGKGEVYLRCPAPNCEDVFRNAEQMEDRLNHHFMPTDKVTAFQHAILQAMCEVKQCPKCNYVRTPRDVGPWKTDSDIRALLKHEYDQHHGEQDLIDLKKFVGFIREHRGRLFGGKDLTRAIRLWKQVDIYHRTNIKQQPEFQDLKAYLVNECGVSPKGDWLGTINETCRDKQFPENPQGTELDGCKNYFPVDRYAFLNGYEPQYREPGRVHVWDLMRAKYWRGDI